MAYTTGSAADYTMIRRGGRLQEDAFQRQRRRYHDRWVERQGRSARLRAGDPNWNAPPGGSQGSTGVPEPPTIEEFKAPEYDEKEVSKLTQKRAAPALRRLRNVTQQALSATHENPNVQRMTVRQALAGYGTGLEGVMAGAGRAATSEYGQRYNALMTGALASYDAKNRAKMAQYSNLFSDYMQKQRIDAAEGDPYDFDSMYGGTGGRGGGSGGGMFLTQAQKTRPSRDAEFWGRPFTRAKTR